MFSQGYVKQIIVYCENGRLWKGSRFEVRKVLGHKNVKCFDGSMQE
jgi:3-mercaptopyruvate sulfurtransferase SseA